MEPIRILMVEPNLPDVRLTEELFKLYKIANTLSAVKDSAEALRFLSRQHEYSTAFVPDIIVVCVSLLWQANAEWLRNIKHDPTLRDVSLVALTASKSEENSLDNGLPIDLCVPKPLDFNCLRTIVNSIDHLYFSIVGAPEEDAIP